MPSCISCVSHFGFTALGEKAFQVLWPISSEKGSGESVIDLPVVVIFLSDKLHHYERMFLMIYCCNYYSCSYVCASCGYEHMNAANHRGQKRGRIHRGWSFRGLWATQHRHWERIWKSSMCSWLPLVTMKGLKTRQNIWFYVIHTCTI